MLDTATAMAVTTLRAGRIKRRSSVKADSTKATVAAMQTNDKMKRR
jgi:hypothetical protein